MRTSLPLLALLFASACGGDVCTRNSDCPASQTCSTEGVCAIAAPGDAGTDGVDEIADAVTVDAATDGGTDAGQ